MKIALESTTKIVEFNGIQARVWQGTTESGVAVVAFITRVAVDRDADTSQFERELTERMTLETATAAAATLRAPHYLAPQSPALTCVCGHLRGRHVRYVGEEDNQSGPCGFGVRVEDGAQPCACRSFRPDAGKWRVTGPVPAREFVPEAQWSGDAAEDALWWLCQRVNSQGQRVVGDNCRVILVGPAVPTIASARAAVATQGLLLWPDEELEAERCRP